jgi:hypothetical protein
VAGTGFGAAKPAECADTVRDVFRPLWIMTNMNSVGMTNASATQNANLPSWYFFCMEVLLIFRFPE